MRSIPIDVLRAFVAVVEARGFTRAAEELGRSQPTISLQVKRLEELIEAPLFSKAARFELTAVGAVCFDYGRSLLRLHDDMLDEASRRMSSDAMLRVGMAAEFASRLTPRLPQLCTDAGVGPGFEVLTDVSDKLAAAFRQSTLDVALVIEAEGGPGEVERWSAPLRWFGESTRRKQPLRLVVAPQGTAFRDAAIGSLRDGAIRFDIVGSSANFAVLAAAAAAGLGVTPMIDGLAPENLKPCPDKNLPALAPATISLLARSEALARAGRRWVEDAISTLQRI